jgi:crossover junction endodeoxyribonuclease RuvC
MRILGVDPGIRGGVALLEGPMLVWAIDIPVSGEKAKQRVNVAALRYRLMKEGRIDHAYIERAQAMPKQGSSSGFLYGRAVGALEAIILSCGIRLTIIEPTKWKKYFKLAGGDKESARQKALMIFPTAHEFISLKKDHGKAEAALIALYGSSKLI